MSYLAEQESSPPPNNSHPLTIEQMRELDAWIAEHVMGWSRSPHVLQDGQIGFYQFSHGGIEVRVASGERLFSFSPTTDPAAAMLVLEKCYERVGLIDMSRVKVAPFNFCIGATYSTGLEAEAETLPLTICLFAKQLFSKV